MSLESKFAQVGPLKFRWDFIVIYVALKFLQGGGSGKFVSVFFCRYVFDVMTPPVDFSFRHNLFIY